MFALSRHDDSAGVPTASGPPLRILVITNAYTFPSEGRPTGGIFFANLLRRLLEMGERIVVVTPVAFIPPPLLRLRRFRQQRLTCHHDWWHGIEVWRPAYFSIRSSRHLWIQARFFCASAARMYWRLRANHAFDVVVGYGLGPAAHAAQFVARGLNRPAVSWAIGTDTHTRPRLSGENLRLLIHNVCHNNMVLTESEDIRQIIVRTCPETKHVHTYYKGIDLAGLKERADRLALRQSLGMGPRRTYMMSAGAVVRPKGVWEFYETFRRLAAERDDLSAIWVGDGAERAALQQRTRAEGLASRFTITGRIPREQVLRTMIAADLMVFPSHAEGLPNVVMEALAAGLPVVTTDVGGVKEVIREGVTGLLVPPKDVPSLTEATRRILQNPGLGKRMAAVARPFILEHFDVDRNASIAREILERIASGCSTTEAMPPCAGVAAGHLPIESLRNEVPTG